MTMHAHISIDDPNSAVIANKNLLWLLLDPELLFPGLLFPYLLFPEFIFPELLFPGLLFVALLLMKSVFPNKKLGVKKINFV